MAGSLNALPKSGRPVLLAELVETTQDGASVRVIGRLHSVEFSGSRAMLADPGGGRLQVAMDTTLVEPVEVKVGSLCEVVGEVSVLPGASDSVPPAQRVEAPGVTLRARLLRCVDGLDWEKFRRALMSQRAYQAARLQSC